MNRLPAGYTSRTDGTYEKRVEWVQRGRNWVAPVTLVRSLSGRLLRVERGKRALAQRECQGLDGAPGSTAGS